MNQFATRQRHKWLVAGVILGTALTVWLWRHQAGVEMTQALERQLAEQHAAKARIFDAEAELAKFQAQQEKQLARRTQALAEAGKVMRELAKVDPESQWASPPETLPEWNPQSPYIWLSKEAVAKFPATIFTATGEIYPQAAFVLDLTPTQMQNVNRSLSRLLKEFQTLEAAHAERTDKHLPGINGKGTKVTVEVKPMPDEGARVKEALASALRSELGEQRADLVMQLGDDWLDSQFSQFGQQPKTYSLIRHTNGSYNLSSRTGGSSMSVGLPSAQEEAVARYIPSHLLPKFAELLQGADARKP